MADNMFGTDGIRTAVGTPPLTSSDIPRLGHAIAQWALKKYSTPLNILLAHDTRASGEWMSAALTTGLLLAPITVHYAHVLPTPAICNILKQRNDLHVGIIISASHNPHQDNGIKIVDRITGKISQKDEEIISAFYHQPYQHTYNTFGKLQFYEKSTQDYTNNIINLFPPDLLSGKKIVLDCAHGATYKIAPAIFTRLGAQVITIHNAPNGTNINEQSGALYVSTLQETVIKENANIGFAFDGDGDRIVAITQTGTIKNGDDMLALLTDHPTYQKEKTIVGTVMSNHGLDLFLQEKKKQLVRTCVGDKYVADYLQKHNGLLGGEQSGHIILNDYLPTSDSIVTALRVLEIVSQTNNWNLHTFKQYPQVLVNVPIGCKKNLDDPAIASIIADYKTQIHAGRLVVRYSGTENVLRVMVEDCEQETAQQISNSLASTLQKELQ